MRIGIDGIPLAATKTGIGHYTFELARELALAAPNIDFELISPFPFLDEQRDGAPPNLNWVRAKVSFLRQRWWTIGLPLYVRETALDLFHGTNYNVPLWNRCRTVVTVHDLSLLMYPETHEAHLVARARRRLPIMVRTATMIITPTESVKRDLCDYLQVAPEKVVAIAEAPRRQFHPASAAEITAAKRKFGLQDDFILFVGTIEPRKNLLTLIQALEEIIFYSAFRPQLVIVGKKGWLSEDLFSYIERSTIKEQIIFTGYVSDDDLRALYSACSVFVYPSLYEGFGLPPLEAMACGAPVVASRISSLMEVTGGAAVLAAPKDVRSFASEIIGILENEVKRSSLSKKGLARAAQFSWKKTALLTLDVYKELLNR